jgi:hypothetical protein
MVHLVASSPFAKTGRPIRRLIVLIAEDWIAHNPTLRRCAVSQLIRGLLVVLSAFEGTTSR